MEKNQKKKQVSSFVKANVELRSLSKSRQDAAQSNSRQYAGRKQAGVSSGSFHQTRSRQSGDQRRGRQRTVTASLANLEHDCQLEDEWWQGNHAGDTNTTIANRRARLARKATYTPANHLLNFHVEAPRDAHVQRFSSRQWRQSRGAGGPEGRNRVVSRTHRPEHIREQYLQARCKFVVRDDTDLSANLTDPDRLLDWHCVEQVWLMQEEGAAGSSTTCPICLCSPRAARITRCGHVFCYTCMLHYLAVGDDRQLPLPRRRCPICEHGCVQPDQLLSCRLLSRQLVAAGTSVTFRLMRRARDSILARPVRGGQKEDEVGPVRVDSPMERQRLTRFLLASPDQVEEHVVRSDREDLQAQLAELADEPEVCFVEQALAMLDATEQRLQHWRSKQQQQCGDDAAAADATDLHSDSDSRVVYSCAFNNTTQLEAAADDGESEVHTATEEVTDELEQPGRVGLASGITPDDSFTAGTDQSEQDLAESGETPHDSAETVELLNDSGVCTAAGADDADNNNDKSFYFYQVDSGEPIFLHALNTAMLLEEHGGVWSQCPCQLTATVLQVDTVTMTDALRRRQRALSHVPLTTEIQTVEVQLPTNLVSSGTLVKFKDQLRRREQQRRAKLRRQRHLEHNGEAKRAANTAFKTDQIYWPSHQDSPSPSLDSFPTPPLAHSSHDDESPVNDNNNSSRSGGAGSGGGLSFAQLVNRPASRAGARAAGTAMNNSSHCEDNDAAVPQFSESWSLDLESALQKLDTAESTSSTHGKDMGKSSSRKKGRRGRVVISNTLPF